MVKTISISDETYEQLYELITQRRMKLFDQGNLENISFNDLISEMLKKEEKEV